MTAHQVWQAWNAVGVASVLVMVVGVVRLVGGVYSLSKPVKQVIIHW